MCFLSLLLGFVVGAMIGRIGGKHAERQRILKAIAILRAEGHQQMDLLECIWKRS